MDDQSEWTGGYGTPPYKNRFMKGQSGNPSGRKAGPPRPRAVGERAVELLRAPVPIQLPGRKRKEKVPMIDAIIMRAGLQVLKHDNPLHAHRFLSDLSKNGFDYNIEVAKARQDERDAASAVIDQQAEAIEQCHAMLDRLARQNAKLAEELAMLKGTEPDEGHPLD